MNTPSIYQCDVCDRQIRIPVNNQGLEVIRHCIITENCRGTLHKNFTTNPYTIPTFPSEQTGLTDWTPRNALYNFTQGIPSVTWTITHNMGTIPAIYAYTSTTSPQGNVSYTEIFPTKITTVDANTSQLTFNSAYSGIAQCVASSTQPVLVSTTIPTVAPAATIQLTNKLTLTIATADAGISVPLTLTISSPTGIVSTPTFDLPQESLTQSPWSNATTVMVNGKKYTIRCLSLSDTTTGQILLANHTIENGTNISTTVTSYSSVLLLLGNAPFSTSDQITTKYIDMASLTTTNAIFYNNGELYVDASYEKTAFPPIIRV